MLTAYGNPGRPASIDIDLYQPHADVEHALDDAVNLIEQDLLTDHDDQVAIRALEREGASSAPMPQAASW
jgi:hypothetical protein